MTATQKVHMISTKNFMYINWGHDVIYLQNMNLCNQYSGQEEHTQMLHTPPKAKS